jgi:hypothetical protein
MFLYIKLLIFLNEERCVFLKLGTEFLICIRMGQTEVRGLRSLLSFMVEVLSSETLPKYRYKSYVKYIVYSVLKGSDDGA